MRKILLIIPLLFALGATAQDLHFSQFYMSPLTLNPAMTGLFNGNYRLTANYRNQWQSVLPSVPFRTIAGSVDFSGRSGSYNRIGAGVHVYSDQAGSLSLSKTQVSVSLAYLLGLSRDKDYYLAAGLHVAFNQGSYNYLKITTGSQWDDTAFDPTLPTGEISLSGENRTYVDAGAGLLWYHIKNIREYQYIGASAFHLNQPNISFFGNSLDRLYAKYVIHTGAGIKLRPRFDMNPYLLGMIQGPDFEITGGTFFKFIMNEKKTTAYGGTSFYIGPYFRIVGNNESAIGYDALIFASKIEIDQITFGLSYDVNISGLNPASSGRGGPEFSVQYIGAFKNKPTGTFCPKF